MTLINESYKAYNKALRAHDKALANFNEKLLLLADARTALTKAIDAPLAGNLIAPAANSTPVLSAVE